MRTLNRELMGLPPGATTTDLSRGRALLQDGLSFPQVRLRLVSDGASHEVSALTMAELASELVELQLILGRPPEALRDMLILRGLDSRAADAAIQFARHRHSQRLYRAGIANGRFYFLAWSAILFGIALAVGNEMGLVKLGRGMSTTVLLTAMALGIYGLWRSKQPVVKPRPA